MPPPAKVIAKALRADDVPARFEQLRKTVRTLVPGSPEPKADLAKLAKHAAAKPLDFRLRFDRGMLYYEAASGSSVVASLGKVDVGAMPDRRKRSDALQALQALKAEGVAAEADIAAVERKALAPQRLALDGAKNRLGAKQAEVAQLEAALAKARGELAVLVKEVKERAAEVQ